MNTISVTINVAKDFSRYPAGRYKKNGDTSGEEFREKFLLPHIAKREPIRVELDGAIGYGSSFLEEAFGGLVRATKLSAKEIFALIKLETSDRSLLTEITEYLEEAEHALKT